ncbi:DUF6402 family protein [Ralstonia nicotianae]
MAPSDWLPYFKREYVGLVKQDWKEGRCKPLKNPQAHILMEKAPAGWTPPAPPKVEKPQPASPAKKQEAPPAPPPKSADKPKSKEEEEDCRTPPPFDMLDLPPAMEKMGFYTAAQVARRWFNGRKYILSSNPGTVYPDDMIDTKIVSLNFTLKYKKPKAKYEKLINEDIYSENAINFSKKIIREFTRKKFVDDGIAFTGEIDSLALSGRDIQKLHHDFQFQLAVVTSFDTLDENLGMTDLTATLGNFFFMAAIASAKIYSEKYYNYSDPKKPTYCCEPKVEITHIYVYARDSYSFADKKGKKSSQYLGHWNRSGVILVPSAAAADVMNNVAGSLGADFDFGNQPDAPTLTPYVYENGFKKPVDIVQGLFRASRKQDIYYPVHNSDYKAWREKFNRGGDFAIYTDLKKIKLSEPIRFTLEAICKPAELEPSK